VLCVEQRENGLWLDLAALEVNPVTGHIGSRSR
jgi:hypothetical protein